MKRSWWPVLVFAGLGLHRLAWLSAQTQGVTGWDFQIYLEALHKAGTGMNPYQPVEIGTGFLNHPALLVLLLPFRNLQSAGLQTAGLILWLLLLAASWLATLVLTHRLFCKNQDQRTLVFSLLFFTPFLEGMFMGQAGIPAALCLALGLTCLQKKSDVFAGFFFGLAALLKLSLVLILLAPVLQRNRRSAAAGAVTMLAAGLPAEWLLYPGITRDFFHAIRSPVLLDHLSGQNHSIFPILGAPLALSILAALLLFLLAKSRANRVPVIFQISVLAASALLFSPLTWHHHFTTLACVLPGLQARRTKTAWLAAGLIQSDLLFLTLFQSVHLAALAAAWVLLLALSEIFSKTPAAQE